jgi:hypothetical protein
LEDRGLVEVRAPGAEIVLASALRGPATQVCAYVANLRAEIQEWLQDHPEDYHSLVLLGEIDLRLGLKRTAREYLYRASLLKPPSWEHYQRTSLLLRRAEADQANEVDRVAGAPPPAFVLAAIGAISHVVQRLFVDRSVRRSEGSP